tara:strand:+ start:231 stop:1241 length:1011 start_codon:yes stop_codon:yes gene_type:complete
MRTIRASQLGNELISNAKADIPSMLWGPPGIGKSQITYALARALGAKLYELRANLFDPVDIRGGLKVVEQEDGTYRTRYGIPEDYPDSNYQGTVVLAIEELPNASKATMNGLLQLILDKQIGSYKLPPNTVIIANGNRSVDRAAVNEMPTPVKNRFAHYTLEANIDDWCAWAVNAGIDPAITAFLRYRPKLLHDMDVSQAAFPTPRSWEMLNRKLPFFGGTHDEEFYGCASLIGDGPAGEFVAFKKMINDMPDIDKCINAPSSVTVPSDTSICFAVAGALAARADQTTFKAIMQFARRMPAEYQVIVVRDSLAKDKTLLQHASFTQWTADNANVLV